jgi:hypothetical protein
MYTCKYNNCQFDKNIKDTLTWIYFLFSKYFKMLDLDMFVCGCGDQWISLHGNDPEQNCEHCGAMVQKSGTQSRV